MTKWLLLFASLTACTDEQTLGNTAAPAVTTRWALSLGSTGADNANGVAVDHTGDVIAGGGFAGTVDFGDREVAAAGYAGWLSKRAGADGHAIWTHAFGTDAAASAAITAVAVASDDSLIVGGEVEGDVDLGGTVVHGPPVPTGPSGFIARYDADGNLVWATPFAGPVAGVAVSPDGHVGVIGKLYGGTSLAFPNATLSSSNDGTYFAVLDTDGQVAWGKGATSSGVGTAPQSIGMTDTADLVVSGTLSDPIELGVITELDPTGSSQSTQWLARFSLAGDPLWADTIGFSGVDSGGGPFALTSTGEVVSAATDNVDGSLSAANGRPRLDAIDAAGHGMWSETAPGGSAVARAIAISGDTTYLAGVANGFAIDFGDGPRTGCVFIATYGATGAFTDASLFETTQNACANGGSVLLALATSDDGGTLAGAGEITEAFDYGTGSLRFAGDSDAVIAVFDPVPAP